MSSVLSVVIRLRGAKAPLLIFVKSKNNRVKITVNRRCRPCINLLRYIYI